MIKPRWRKLLRDLWGNKARTLLVVLSIAVGVFAVGMVTTSQEILRRDLANAYAAVNPMSAALFIRDPLDNSTSDEDLIQRVRALREVREAEGHRGVNVRFKVGSDGWRNMLLIAIPDYEDIRVNKILPEAGAWPPSDRELLIERASLDYVQADIGDMTLIETPDGRQRELRVAGLAYDVYRLSPALQGTAYGYITFDTLEWLGEPRHFNSLGIIAAGNTLDKKYITRVTTQVRDTIEKSGRVVHYVYIPTTPGEHPADDIVQPIVLVLGLTGFLALLLSGFLVINTISALLTQQVQQIGVMKAIGAGTNQIIGLYLGLVLIYSLFALTIAVPSGTFGARAFTRYIAGLLNVDIASFSTPSHVFVLEVVVGLMMPLLAALYPVISGTRITVREAISEYGLGKGRFGTGLIDRLFEQVRGLPRPLLLSLRNTSRRKGRLALTLVTLISGSALIASVLSVHASTLHTLDEVSQYNQFDVQVNFSRPYRIERIEREVSRVPGVVNAESWGFNTVHRLRSDNSESQNISFFAPPVGSDLIQPTVLAGRWLLPDDENAIVINTDLLKEEPDIKVGEEIVLKIEGRETTWQVVGIITGQLLGPAAYANYTHFARVARDVGRASRLLVETERHDVAFQSQVARAVEAHFQRVDLRVSQMETQAEVSARIAGAFNPVVISLLVMAVLLALVGGLGLMGTMSLNVLERTREIGVIRAIGASNGAVLQIIIVEGILIGVLSWLFGTVLSLPLGKFLSDTVGVALVQAPLHYTFSTIGVLIWLVLVVILAALASFLPAWNASRLSVRESLAYE
jgi:putative ABC transport system permease protein